MILRLSTSAVIMLNSTISVTWNTEYCAVFLPTAQRIGQAVAGEMSADDAIKRLTSDIDEQVKAASK